MLALISIIPAHDATPISIHPNAFSVMINTILQAPQLVLPARVEFLTVLDVPMMVKEVLDALIAVTIMSLLTIILVLHVEFLLTTVKVANKMELGKDYVILVWRATSLLMEQAVFFVQVKSINVLIAIKLVDME